MTTRRLFSLLLLLALLAMSARQTLDPDMWWHLRTGQVIVQDGIPRHDLFSFTVPEHPWVTHEWLSQVIMWGLYRLGAMPALILFFAALNSLTFWLIYRGSAGQPYLAGFLVLLAALASSVVWGARPQMFNLFFTALFIFVIEGYRAGRLSGKLLYLLPLFTAIWANLHSGYLLGVVLLATYTVGAGLDRAFAGSAAPLDWPAIRPLAARPLAARPLAARRLATRRLATISLLSLLAAALNPNGTSLWLYPFFTLGSNAMQATIQEWQSPNFHLAIFWPFAGMIFLGALGWAWSGRRPGATELLLFLGTAAAGLLSARHIPLFALVATPILARHWQAILGQRLPGQTSGGLPALNWLLLLLATVGAAGWVGQQIAGNDAAVVARFPVAAVDFLQQSGLAVEHGFNSYNWGGYLIWRGLPVFVDGRADVYGDPFLRLYRQTFDSQPAWEEPLDRFDVRYVLMERDDPLTVLLAASGRWQQVYADGVAQVFVKQGDGQEK